jgi:hypothetical protein
LKRLRWGALFRCASYKPGDESDESDGQSNASGDDSDSGDDSVIVAMLASRDVLNRTS